jgi:signal transduction histidine kinase/streptogramin lyase
VLPASDGGVWVIAHRFQKFYPNSPHSPSPQDASGQNAGSEGRWEEYGPLPRSTDLFDDFLEDRHGNLWVGTGVGELWRVDTNRTTRRFKLLNSAPRDFKSLFEDAEGNLWLGTWGSGLARLKPRPFKTYDARDGISSDVVRSVTQDQDGNIWLAAVSKVDWFPPNASGRAEPRGLNVSLPWNVFGSRNGPVWIGTFAQGLFRFEGESATRFPFAERVKPPIDVILENRRGEIYAGTPRGLFVVRGDNLERYPPPNAAITMAVNSLAEDSQGRLYVGLSGDGLLRHSSNEWECFAIKDGLPDNNISAICVDTQDHVWIATHGKGFARFKDGRVFNFSEAQVALPRFVSRLIEDDTGHLWFTSHQGLFRADLRQLNEVAEGRKASAETTHYDRADGMGSSQCFGSAWKAQDGKLWVATMNGVTVVDPHSLPLNPRPPPVVIEQALVDDKPLQTSFSSGARITLPPGAHRLEIHYAGLSFTAPSKVRFRYRLQGLDENWVEANDRRVAYYTKVPPGDYRFQVIAANNDNVWNSTGVSLAVVAQPYVWQRGWFRILSALFLVGSAAGLVRYISQVRLRRRLAELERRHALEKERSRISRDLHDHLGADLSQLALWSELAAQEKDRPERMVDRVRSVSSLAREVIQNVDEIVWTMNPKNDSLDRFAAYVCEFSERLVTGAGLRFRWEAPDKIRAAPLSSEVRHHLFLVTKEALNNVVKHARATEARVELDHASGECVLTISDNGRGFDTTTSASSGSTGNGLTNMQQRIAQCGGQLTIQSQNGGGTLIRIRIPLRASR